MKNNAIAETDLNLFARFGEFLSARHSTFAFSGGLLFLLWDDKIWKTTSIIAILALVAVLVIAALVASALYEVRARADKRWRATLDRYAEQEEKKIANSRKYLHAHPQA